MIPRYGIYIHTHGGVKTPYRAKRDNGDYVTYDDHLSEVAKLTEELRFLRKVAEQATAELTLSIISGREFFIRDDLGEKYVRGFADAKPELFAYLKAKENQNG